MEEQVNVLLRVGAARQGKLCRCEALLLFAEAVSYYGGLLTCTGVDNINNKKTARQRWRAASSHGRQLRRRRTNVAYFSAATTEVVSNDNSKGWECQFHVLRSEMAR